MRTITTLVLTLFFVQSTFGQKINYSSDMKYQNVNLNRKFSNVKIETSETNAEKTAIVKMPFISNKKQIYGALVVKSK